MSFTCNAGAAGGRGKIRFTPIIRYLSTVTIVAALYILAAHWGLSFWIVQNNVTLVWPPAGIALAALLICGYRVLPGIVVGALVATASTGAPLAFAIATGIGNPLEALVAAWLLRRVARVDHELGRVHDVLGLIGLAAILSTTIGATVGTSTLCALGLAPWPAFGDLWFSWWLGDALGIVIVTPVLLTWAARSAVPWQPARAIEAAAFIGLLALATHFVFGASLTPAVDHLFLVYVPFPFLIWAAVRYGPRGATTATLIVSAIAIAGIAGGHGPFRSLSLQDQLATLMTFISIFALTALILAAAVAERNRAEQALRGARDELEQQVAERTAALTDANSKLAADIAERQRVEEEVRTLSRFPEESPYPVLRLARDGTILYANKSSTPLLAAWDRRVSESVPDDWRTCATTTLESGANQEIEVRCNDRVFSCILAPVCSADHVNVFGREITAQKRAAEAHERLATAVEQAAEAVVITDVSGQIEYVNPAFERITGYSQDEAIGQNTRFLKSGQHDDAFYRQLWETITRGETWTGRLINRRRDGTLYHEDVTISPVRDDTGRIVNFVGLKRDVSREVQLETQLRQSQTLEAVGQLAGGVAHEFNNLLTAILGGSEIIAASVAADHPARGHARRIKQSTDRAAELIHQLLAFGRKQIVRPRVLNLNDVVGDALKLLRPLLGEHIRIETQLASNLGFVRADHDQIVQLLTNLCVNARDAMPQGGTLSIETAPVGLEQACGDEGESVPPGRYATLSVRDSGHGIDAKTRAHLFEPFFTTKEVGQGATFRVYLPCVAEKLDAPPAPHTTGELRRDKVTLLLVEDEEEVREVARHILVAEGYDVLTAENGDAALRVCEQHPGRLDLLVTDVVMPRMGGPELVQRMAGLHPETKVLYTSGYASSFLTARGGFEPGTAFLPKPFTRRTLAAKVREVLDAGPARHVRPSAAPLTGSAC